MIKLQWNCDGVIDATIELQSLSNYTEFLGPKLYPYTLAAALPILFHSCSVHIATERTLRIIDCGCMCMAAAPRSKSLTRDVQWADSRDYRAGQVCQVLCCQ